MSKSKFKVSKRTELGKNLVKQLKQRGIIPGVVYGNAQEPIPVSIDRSELLRFYRSSEYGVNSILDLEFDDSSGSNEVVMAQEILKNAITQEVEHVDFIRVSEDKKIDIFLPISFVGSSVGQKLGGILIRNKHQVRIKCYPKDIRPNIEIDVTDLDIGDSIKILDLDLGDDVEFLASPDALVVSCEAPKVEVTIEEDEAVEGDDAAGTESAEGESAVASDSDSDESSDS